MSVPRALAWSLSGQVVTFLVSFGSSVVVARLISPHEMGIYVLAQAIVGALTSFSAFGIGAYVVRAPELPPGTIDAAFTLNALLALGLAAVLVGASGEAAALWREPALAPAMRYLAAGPILAAIEFRPTFLLQRRMEFRTVAAIDAGKVTVSAAVAVALVSAGYGFMGLAYGYVAGGVFGALAYNVVGREHAAFRLSVRQWGPMLAFGLRTMTVGSVGILAARLSELMLGGLLGLDALGLYSRAAGIATLIVENVYAVVARVIFVQLAAELRDRGSVRETFLRSLAVVTALLWPALLGLALLARPVVSLLYGEPWLGAALPLSLLLLAQAIVLGLSFNWELAVLRDETGRQARFESVRAGAGLAMFALGATFSVAAAAAAKVAEALLAVALYRPHLERMAGAGPGDLGRIYRQGAALTLAAAAPALILMAASGWSERTSPAGIAAAVGAGGGLWLVVLMRLDHPLRAAMTRLAARIGPG